MIPVTNLYESTDQFDTLTSLTHNVGGAHVAATAYGGRAGGFANPEVMYYGDADANCCPSEELVVELSLRRNALVLSKPPVVRRLP